MFWIFLCFVAFATILIKLGAASVMVSVLSIGLRASIFLIAILAVLLLWKKFTTRKNQAGGKPDSGNSIENR